MFLETLAGDQSPRGMQWQPVKFPVGTQHQLKIIIIGTSYKSRHLACRLTEARLSGLGLRHHRVAARGPR